MPTFQLAGGAEFFQNGPRKILVVWVPMTSAQTLVLSIDASFVHFNKFFV